jgi:hypothetical protein
MEIKRTIRRPKPPRPGATGNPTVEAFDDIVRKLMETMDVYEATFTFDTGFCMTYERVDDANAGNQEDVQESPGD